MKEELTQEDKDRAARFADHLGWREEGTAERNDIIRAFLEATRVERQAKQPAQQPGEVTHWKGGYNAAQNVIKELTEENERLKVEQPAGWREIAKDGLPPVSKVNPDMTKDLHKVLVYSPKLGIDTGYYWGELDEPMKGWTQMNVTHWMPLPELPEVSRS